MDETLPTPEAIPEPPQGRSRYPLAKPDDEIGQELVKRWKDYHQHLMTHPYAAPILSAGYRTYQFYYGISEKGHRSYELGSAGEQGELSTLMVNHTRSLIENKVSLVTQERPALTPTSINGDYKSRAQTILASSVMDYYVKGNLEAAWKKMCEQAFIWSVSYLKAVWDPTLGAPAKPTKDMPNPPDWMKEGDIRFNVLTPLDVAFEHRARDRDHRWMITREFRNRYDLAVQFPAWEEEILDLSSTDSASDYEHLNLLGHIEDGDQNELIPVYEFFHKRTPALPSGKHVIYLSDGSVLYSGELPTKNLPIVQLSAGEVHGTCWSYSPFWDTGGLQTAANVIASVIMTNAAVFGGTTLFIDKASNLNRSSLGQALQILEGRGDKKPEVLDLLRTNGQLFEALSFIQTQMELLSGINATLRGQVDANVKSGADRALIHSTALQFASSFIGDFNRLMEASGGLIFEMLKRFAVNTRTIPAITGKSQRYMLKEFQGEDLSDIDRVQVEVSNPMTRSVAGKLELANKLTTLETDELRQMYTSIITTGRMEPLTEAPMTKVMNLRRENELLMEGVEVLALITDDHIGHIKEHLSLLDDPDVRNDPELVDFISAHVQEHLGLYGQLNPDLAAILNLPPLPSMQQQMPPGEGEMPPEGPGGPEQGPPPPEGGQPPEEFPGANGDPNMPNLPKMPNNPATGEEYDPGTGQ